MKIRTPLAAVWLSLAGLVAVLGAPGEARAQVSLVKDIRTTADTSPGTSPTSVVNVGGTIFFAGTDVNGTELWKYDGTTASLVADIFPGAASSSPSSLTAVGGVLYFTASDTSSGVELWKSDGTAAGTVLVKDIVSGSGSSSPANLRAVGTTLFFTADDGVNGVELWKSDGTPAGTSLVADIAAGPASSSPSNLTSVSLGGTPTLLFAANDGVNGVELWKSDGAGATLVKDVNTAAGASSNPTWLADVGGVLFFAASDGTNGVELWKSDGTAAGTTLVRNINTGAGRSSNPAYITNVGGVAFFAANDTVGGTGNGNELWKSDGTSAGTVLVSNINAGKKSSNPANITNVGGTAFFAARSTGGVELWKSDGTGAGTSRVKDIAAGGPSSSPANLVNAGGVLYFTASTPAAGVELWTSDGTTAGTVQVKDIFAGLTSSTPTQLTPLSGTSLVLSANDGTNGVELWKSDGTSAGTVLATNASSSASAPAYLTDAAGTLFFAAGDGTNGVELWKSDGTGAGTVLVQDIFAGAAGSSPAGLVAIGSTVYFAANDGTTGVELWKSDGTTTGQVADLNPGAAGSNPSSLTVVGSALFFAADDGTNGVELWRYDGVNPPVLMDPAGGGGIDPVGSSSPAQLTNVAGTLFFSANDGSGAGIELWKSDGTSAGTVPVADINPVADSLPLSLTALGATLFFTADDGTNGRELWTSDGTTTTLVADVAAGAAGSSPSALVAVGATLFFTANDGATGTELWKSDGTGAGTVVVKDIASGSASSSPFALANAGGRLFFAATDATSGTELWTSDGTAAGTVLVKDISAGTGSSLFAGQSLGVSGANVVFAAYTAAAGQELWKSDGTAAGTVLVQDIQAGAGASLPALFTVSGPQVYFAADEGATGTELWKLTAVDLGLTQTDAADPILLGANASYTVTVANAGPSIANGVTLTDTLPAGTAFVSVTPGAPTCSEAAGVVTCALGTLATGASSGVIIVVTPPADGLYTNQANVSATEYELRAGNNTSSETTTVGKQADLAITKTDGATTAVPGQGVSYTITASNAGPSDVTGAVVSDAFAATLSSVTWTCAASAGSSCPASGSGDIAASVNLLSGGSATFTASATVSASATGTLSNTATVAAPVGVTDSSLGNNSATDSDSLTPQADLAITKTDGSTTAVPGQGVSYTITVSNAGPSDVTGASVTDTLPATLSSATWTCSVTGTGSCTASGSGDIGETVLALAVGAQATYVLTASLDPAATGGLTNTASVAAPAGTADPSAANDSATDSDTLTPQADLGVTKASTTAPAPAQPVTYLIVVTNAGPSAVSGASVTDALPSALSGATWTCSVAGTGACAASGSGSIADASLTLAPGASATYTLTADVDISAIGTLSNTASVAAPAGVSDPNAANDSATDSDLLGAPVSLSIGDASIVEGNSGTADVVLAVSLSAPSGASVAVDYATASATARSGYDFLPMAGTLTFAPGSTQQTLSVPVVGDALREKNEAFVVALSSPVNATLARARGQAVVRDDDSPRPDPCSPVVVAPITLDAPGQYCLAGNLGVSLAAGAAIAIEADDVTVDLKGFRIRNTAGPATQAVGIAADNRHRLSLRSGSLSGFFVGVLLAETTPDTAVEAHRVQRLSLSDDTSAGLWVEGSHSTVSGNTVQRTIANTAFAADADAYGIVVKGAGARVADNAVRDTFGAGAGAGHGIVVSGADAARVQTNRVSNSFQGETTGIQIDASLGVDVLRNRLLRQTTGILFSNGATGTASDNVFLLVQTPQVGP